jgi:citrate synthase
MVKKTVRPGLKNVVALQSNISRVDGEKGILEYRGYNIHDLAKYSTFEECAFLLWHGHLPKEKELEKFSRDLAKRRDLPPEIVNLLRKLPRITHPTVVLRTAISYLGSLDKKLQVITPKECLEKSKNLFAKIPTIVAYYQRIRERKSPIPPKKNLSYAENFLWMLFGREPSKIESKAIETDFILHAEHGLNASTFSARISASTLSDMYAGVVSATGTLFGPSHGGAAQKVMAMLREIKGKNVQKWVGKRLEKGERIMGFGHRVYKVWDPRAKELKKLAEGLDKVRGRQWLALSNELVEAVQKQKPNLYPNVDFFSASVYANLGIPDDLFINIFTVARIAGWTAHLMEQYQNNILIRPLQNYKGKTGRKYPKTA